MVMNTLGGKTPSHLLILCCANISASVAEEQILPHIVFGNPLVFCTVWYQAMAAAPLHSPLFSLCDEVIVLLTFLVISTFKIIFIGFVWCHAQCVI